MKKYLLYLSFLLIAALPAYSQDTLPQLSDAEFEQLFSNIKGFESLETNFLREKTVSFIDLTQYNGQINDSNAVDEMKLRALYAQFSKMQITNASKYFNQFDYMDGLMRSFRKCGDTLQVMGFAARYNAVKKESLENGTFTIDQKKIKINDASTTINRYTEEKTAFAAGLLGKQEVNQNVVFYFDSNLFYTDVNFNKGQLLVNFDDGLGFRKISWDQYIGVNYPGAGEKQVTFRIDAENEVLYSYSQLKVAGNMSLFTIDENFDATHRFTASLKHAASGGYASGLVTVAHGESSNKKLDKPILVIEGFDESDYIGPDLVDKKDYRYFIEDKLADNFTFINNIQNNGYDIVHLNFDNTGDFMQNQAYLVQRVISWLRTHPERTEDIVVIGLSSGGIIGRYALADWENRYTYDHDVRLLATFDSGHDGNNVPVGAQHMIEHLNDMRITGVNLRYLIPSLVDIKRALNSPASRQMLIEYMEPNNSLHRSFFDELDALGYPQKSRNIAIASGSGGGNGPGIGDNDYIIKTNKFGGEIVLPIVTGVVSLKITGGFLPLLSTSVEIKSLAANSVNTEVYDGRYFGILPIAPILVLMSSRERDHTGKAAYASAPGGLFFEDNVPFFPDLNNVGFVPTASALDIMNHRTPNPRRRPSTTDFCDTPFDAWYAPTNNEMHVEWNSGNTAFLWSEINDNNAPCNSICGADISSGPSILCTSNSTFNLNNVPPGATVSWSVSPTSLFAVDNGSGTSFTTRATNSSTSGRGTIRAHLSGSCGTTTIEKTVWVGAPPTPTGNEFGEPISYNLSLDGVPDEICVSSASASGSFYAGYVADDASSFVNHWETDAGPILTNPSPTNYSSVTVRINNNGNNRFIRVRAQNACGYGPWETKYFDLLYQPFGCSGGGGGIGFALQYSPNPVEESLTLDITSTSLTENTPDKSASKSKTSDQYSVVLRDDQGKIVFNRKSTNQKYTIPMHGFKRGYYYLVVEKDEQQQTAKIWKE